MRETRTLRSTWRGLETWHGRDAVTPRNRKGEATVNTNIDLNRRASLRPYLGARGGEIPPRNFASKKLMHRSKQHCYSITSSARASSVDKILSPRLPAGSGVPNNRLSLRHCQFA